ncbi:hypothetical protein pipiens_015513 [Culex pipiens pipiens]|uniref:Uncharacterized protein n=1 Tax=Culex pipiens pipiens TaxID=38569 RepID=A0ABD1CQ43_CULPP
MNSTDRKSFSDRQLKNRHRPPARAKNDGRRYLHRRDESAPEPACCIGELDGTSRRARHVGSEQSPQDQRRRGESLDDGGGTWNPLAPRRCSLVEMLAGRAEVKNPARTRAKGDSPRGNWRSKGEQVREQEEEAKSSGSIYRDWPSSGRKTGTVRRRGPKMTDDDICTEGTNRHRSRPAALDHWTKHAGARGMLGVNNLRKINAGGEKVWTTAEARGIRLLRGGAREWKCWPVGPR